MQTNPYDLISCKETPATHCLFRASQLGVRSVQDKAPANPGPQERFAACFGQLNVELRKSKTWARVMFRQTGNQICFAEPSHFEVLHPIFHPCANFGWHASCLLMPQQAAPSQAPEAAAAFASENLLTESLMYNSMLSVQLNAQPRIRWPKLELRYSLPPSLHQCRLSLDNHPPGHPCKRPPNLQPHLQPQRPPHQLHQPHQPQLPQPRLHQLPQGRSSQRSHQHNHLCSLLKGRSNHRHNHPSSHPCSHLCSLQCSHHIRH